MQFAGSEFEIKSFINPGLVSSELVHTDKSAKKLQNASIPVVQSNTSMCPFQLRNRLMQAHKKVQEKFRLLRLLGKAGIEQLMPGPCEELCESTGAR